MSVRIRLNKIGKTNSPSYRIVAVERRSSRTGRSLEILGHYNPSGKAPALTLDKKRLENWIGKGAQLSEAVKQLAAGKYVYRKYHPSSTAKSS